MTKLARRGPVVSSLDVAPVDISDCLRAMEAVTGCEPDDDHLRDVLLAAIKTISGADGVALFEIDGDTVLCREGRGACASLTGTRLPRAETVLGSLTAQSPVDVDVATAPDRTDVEVCRDVGLTRLVLVPLQRGRRRLGMVLIGFRDGSQRFIAADDLLQAVVRIGAARLEHLAIANERAAKDKLSASIAEAARAVLASETPAQTLCDWARRLTGASYASFLEPRQPDELVLTAQSGANLPTVTLRLDDPSLAVTVFLSGRAQLVSNYREHPENLARVTDAISVAGLPAPTAAAYVPVRTAREAVGVISLLLNEPYALPTMSALGLLGRLATEAALAIDRDRLRRELEQQASTDSLTAVANRRTYVSRLAQELARAKRSGAPVTLVLVDLDHFKAFNDRHGHQAGDSLLRTVTERWLKQMRTTDLLARLGGDEFAVILPETNAQDALAFCERMLAALPDDVTASAGVAQWNGDEDQLAFYRRCDDALYDAKKSGRRQARVAS